MMTSCISAANRDFGAEWLLGVNDYYATLHGVQFFNKRLEKHPENYPGLEILHISKLFQKKNNVFSDGKTTN